MDRTRIIALAILVTLLANSAFAQQSTRELSPARQAATAKRRAWLIKRLVDPVQDRAQRESIRARLDRLTPDEVEAAVNHYLERQQEARDAARRSRASDKSLSSPHRELDQATRVRDALAQEVERRRGGASGFAPVITWLPEGASLTASAAISPDGRYVRTTVNPFFSSIGPVDTFNFYGGGGGYYPGVFHGYGYGFGVPQYQYIEKRIYAGPIPAQPYHHGHHHHHHHRGRGYGGHRPKIWYDGLRTRVGKY